MGRDQRFNAERVEALGAGRMLTPDCDAATIADAALAVLEGDRYLAAAKWSAITIAGYGGAAAAVTALGNVLTPERAP